MTVILRSNRGTSSVTIDVEGITASGEGQRFEATVQLASEHYDGDHEYPALMSIEGLWLAVPSIQGLARAIDGWVEQPLQALASSALVGDFQLAILDHQSLRLSFGSRVDTISGCNPVATVELAAGTFRGTMHFVTDQSCLRLFAADLFKLGRP